MLTYQLNFLSSCPHLLSAVMTATHHHTSFKGCQGLNPWTYACKHSTKWATSSTLHYLYFDFFICNLTLPCLHPCPHSGWGGRPSPFDHHPLLCAFSQLVQAASLSWESFGFWVLAPVISTDDLRMTGWWMLLLPYRWECLLCLLWKFPCYGFSWGSEAWQMAVKGGLGCPRRIPQLSVLWVCLGTA